MPSSLSILKVNLSTILPWLLFALLKTSANASSFNEPHSHQGVVTPFQPGDPKVPLDSKAKHILGQGKPYQTQVQSAGSGRGLVVQDIDAPPSIVWGRILDYDNYSKMVPKTIESKNYKVIDVKPTKKDPLSQIIYTRMKVGFPVLKLEFFIKHLYFPSMNSLTWTLDYDKNSDFNDSCGYWYVIEHPDSEERTRVYYSVEVSMFDWVPKFVVDFMSTKALTDATAWVKKYSELEYAKQGGSKKRSDDSSSDSGTTGTSTSSDQQKEKRGFFGGLFGNKKKREEESLQAQLEAKRIAEEERFKAEAQAKKILQLTWIRLGLVSAVTVFVIYDFHLWLSG